MIWYVKAIKKPCKHYIYKALASFDTPFCGEGGIRTPVTVTGKTDFESVPFNQALALLLTTIAAF